jgi:hypothetical protein
MTRTGTISCFSRWLYDGMIRLGFWLSGGRVNCAMVIDFYHDIWVSEVFQSFNQSASRRASWHIWLSGMVSPES